MIKSVSSAQINIFELEQEQIDSLREVLSSIKFLSQGDSLADAQKKEASQTNLNVTIKLEKEVSKRLIGLEQSARDYVFLFPVNENAQRIKASVPFLNKYNINEWLTKLLKYLSENNFSLAQRTIEQELLDSQFGMMAGRLEHTKSVEQALPEDEKDEAKAYNVSYDNLYALIKDIQNMSSTAKYKEVIDVKQSLVNLNEAIKSLFGKGILLWKKGAVPAIESHYSVDFSKIKHGESIELSPMDIEARSKTLSVLSEALNKVHTAAFHLLEGNISSSTDQIESEKKRLADNLILFNNRAFNLIVPLAQRESIKSAIKFFNMPYKMSNFVEIIEENSSASSFPDFVYEYFLAMESLAKDAKQKAEESNYKDAVVKLEEIYHFTLRRDWERLRKIKDKKAADIVMSRVNEVKELVQAVRNIVRDVNSREKQFTQLILVLGQTNQLLAAKRGK